MKNILLALEEARLYHDNLGSTNNEDARVVELYEHFATLAMKEIERLNGKLAEIITLPPGRRVHCIGCSLPSDITQLEDIIKRAKE